MRYGQEVHTIFDLFGSKENDMTFALGWVFSKSTIFLQEFLANTIPGDWAEPTDAVIRLQTGRGDDGITDIEITLPGRLLLIIEAKRGPELPTSNQLEKYARVLDRGLEDQKHLIALTNASIASAETHLTCAGMTASSLHHCSWRVVYMLAERSAAREQSGEVKRWLRSFSTYVKGLLGMEMKYSNRVFVVSVGGQDDCWSISRREIVEQKQRYFFPVGHRWPDPPPNYLAFRYEGKLQSIHHVEDFTTFTNPHEIFPEAPEDQVWPLHYCVKLGPPICPPREVLNGPRIQMSNRVWCFLDTLLTCRTISDALTETQRRESDVS